jgi:hypothetical protein
MEIFFDANTQSYSVYYKGKFMTRKFRFTDVKSYVD